MLTGKRPPEIETVAMIAGALDIPVWALMIDGLGDHPEFPKVGALKPFEQLVWNDLATTPERVTIEKAGSAAMARWQR